MKDIRPPVWMYCREFFFWISMWQFNRKQTEETYKSEPSGQTHTEIDSRICATESMKKYGCGCREPRTRTRTYIHSCVILLQNEKKSRKNETNNLHTWTYRAWKKYLFFSLKNNSRFQLDNFAFGWNPRHSLVTECHQSRLLCNFVQLFCHELVSKQKCSNCWQKNVNHKWFDEFFSFAKWKTNFVYKQNKWNDHFWWKRLMTQNNGSFSISIQWIRR